jgi:hypothetical protein
MLCATKMLFSSHGNAFVKTSYYYNSTRPKSLSLSPRSGDAEANKQVLQHTINFCARATSPGTSLRVLSKQALVSARQLDSNDNSPMFYGVASQIEISLRFDHEPCSELVWAGGDVSGLITISRSIVQQLLRRGLSVTCNTILDEPAVISQCIRNHCLSSRNSAFIVDTNMRQQP